MRWSWWVVKKHVHTCMLAMWAPIHISNSHNTQGRKVLKWIFSLLQNQNQHLNYTIKVAQSFCFYIYRELFFLIMKFKLWWFGEKKSNHNLFSGVHEWIVCIAKHLSFVICCAHTYKKKTPDWGFELVDSIVYTLWEFVGFPSRWCWWCNVPYYLLFFVISVWNVVQQALYNSIHLLENLYK